MTTPAAPHDSGRESSPPLVSIAQRRRVHAFLRDATRAGGNVTGTLVRRFLDVVSMSEQSPVDFSGVDVDNLLRTLGYVPTDTSLPSLDANGALAAEPLWQPAPPAKALAPVMKANRLSVVLEDLSELHVFDLFNDPRLTELSVELPVMAPEAARYMALALTKEVAARTRFAHTSILQDCAAVADSVYRYAAVGTRRPK
jgi:hypothetical protein